MAAGDQEKVWEMASLEMEGMIQDLNRQLEMLQDRIDELERYDSMFGFDCLFYVYFTLFLLILCLFYVYVMVFIIYFMLILRFFYV